MRRALRLFFPDCYKKHLYNARTCLCKAVNSLGVRPCPKSVSYFTDAASLRRAYDYPPTVILGPGEPEMAHQTDEYCRVAKIQESVEVYSQIIHGWCRV